jgi:hypothetical protein
MQVFPQHLVFSISLEHECDGKIRFSVSGPDWRDETCCNVEAHPPFQFMLIPGASRVKLLFLAWENSVAVWSNAKFIFILEKFKLTSVKEISVGLDDKERFILFRKDEESVINIGKL